MAINIEDRETDRHARRLASLTGRTITQAVKLAVKEQVAREAFRRFGRGNHPAGLTFGGCFACALAKQLDAPLLYGGDDVARTDVRPALRAR